MKLWLANPWTTRWMHQILWEFRPYVDPAGITGILGGSVSAGAVLAVRKLMPSTENPQNELA